MMRNTIYTLVIITLLFLQGCANTKNHSSSNVITTTTNETSKILLMPLDVELAELTALGSLETKADWTEDAKKHMKVAIDKHMNQKNAKTQIFDDNNNSFDSVSTQLSKLHEVVGYSVLVHHFGHAPLPAKQNQFDWTLGEEAKVLAKETGADYALFVFVRDSYASAGRKAAQFFGAMVGLGIQGGTQVGFSSLVDLKSGDIVWFNRLVSTTGDLRSEKAAIKSMANLLDSFPTSKKL